MKKTFLLIVLMSPILIFGQNDLKISSNIFTYYQRTEQLNRQIELQDSIYNLKLTQKLKADSISFAKEENKKGNSEQLKPVFLTSKKAFEYGYHQRKGFFGRLFHKNTQVMGYVSIANRQQAVYLKDTLSNKELLIKELLLRVWSHKKDSLATIKIHLYPVDIAHKKIGYDLLDSLTVKPASTRYQLLHLN